MRFANDFEAKLTFALSDESPQYKAVCLELTAAQLPVRDGGGIFGSP